MMCRRRRQKSKKPSERPTSRWQPGTYVWGCMNKSYWPGIIVNNKDLNFKPPTLNKSWIFWFGDYRVSQLRNADIFLFHSHFKHVFQQRSNMKVAPIRWKRGVMEAIREYGSPETLNYNDNELIEYANTNFDGITSNENASVTKFVFDKLKSISNRNKDKDLDDKSKVGASGETKVVLKEMLEGTKNFKDICLACYTSDISDEHPLFEGSICNDCKEKIKKSFYVIGNDSIKYCCSICGCLGNMVVCSNRGCGFVYCSKCLDDLGLPKARQNIIAEDPWCCFVCDKNSSNGLIKSRTDWKERVHLLFGDTNRVTAKPTIPEIKKPIRVLSLFDGIATGLHALIKLNISVECYYSCEIDEDSIKVVKKNYPGGVTLLGDVRNLTEEAIKEILPIDLLIGGSPCNDLSMVNPRRRGLYDMDGTGVLFFEFYRILTNLQMYNEREFFWFYENVASMSVQSRVSISRFLQCEPELIDAAWVSSQARPRIFWGNLPTLHGQEFMDDGPNLQHYLIDDRKAAVKKLRTVTTKSNSLKQGPLMQGAILDGTDIDIVELEQIFGLPRDYTKVGDISKAARQKLLGQAWSVQSICLLLRFLQNYYKEYES